MDNLKPCPFCGGEATRLSRRTFNGTVFEIECDNYGCKISPSVMQGSQKAADEAWNTRNNEKA